MKGLRYTGTYKRDFKRVVRRKYDLRRLSFVITALRTDATLPAAAHPHLLKGEWLGYWECHVEPDWLLIYKVTNSEVLLARTGTHADLFE